MEFDFCLVASWAEQSHRQLVAWGTELEKRGYRVAIVSPSSSKRLSRSDVRGFILSDLAEGIEEYPSPKTVESRYGIPSLDHLAFTERLYFNLSRERVLSRAVRLVAAIEGFFSDHSSEYTFQVRGPEMHRLLAHYATEHQDGTSIWADFSPFDGTFALSTALDGSWDNYRSIPFEDIPESHREDTARHVEQFREERRFYAHEKGEEAGDDGGGVSAAAGRVVDAFGSLYRRDRPGRLRDQVLPEGRLRLNRRVNERLLPTTEESRRRCRETDYVFFPLQYPVESRLTVFSPEFYDQTYLLEYLKRVLPSSTSLFVKGHPNHPGRPAPETIRRIREEDRVTFLDHDLNAHEVIEHAEAVVVVNNTVGYETIYHRKPLVALGDPPYAATPAVTSVDGLHELPGVLADAVSSTVPRETAIESLYSLREAAFPGDRSSYEDGNVRTLVDSVLEFAGE